MSASALINKEISKLQQAIIYETDHAKRNEMLNRLIVLVGKKAAETFFYSGLEIFRFGCSAASGTTFFAVGKISQNLCKNSSQKVIKTYQKYQTCIDPLVQLTCLGGAFFAARYVSCAFFCG